MSTIHLVRHGQASFGAADYDALSDVGPVQVRALARQWLTFDERPTALYSGAMLRQRQSEQALREVYEEAGVALPGAKVHGAFNEYAHKPMLKTHAEWLNETTGEPVDRDRLKTDRRYFHYFTAEALKRWIRGELHAEGLEAWSEFKARCNAGIDEIREHCGSGQTVAVFTSAGAIGAILSRVLGLDDEHAMDLKLGLYNASVSSLVYSAEQITVSTFNCIGHLAATGDRSLITYR